MPPTESFAGAKVTVMGLGLHGGGASAARYFARAGAEVTVTDLRDETALSASLEALGNLSLRFVLGRHEQADFTGADIVVKNPAVPRTSAYLARARRVETDISVFLARNPAPFVAITGTKGKSSTSAALHHILSRCHPGRAHLGGNITRSPLEFIDELVADDVVVLELSSFQLGDLRMTPSGIAALTPRVAIITSIFRDHLDYYDSMEEYVADKRLIYAAQGPRDWTIARADAWGRSFLAETPARAALVADGRPAAKVPTAAYLEGLRGRARLEGADEEVLPAALSVRGEHMRRNLLAAALGARLLGFPPAEVRDAAATFGGIDHRLEAVRELDGVTFYNDSAATIPEATLEAVGSFDRPVRLIAGGSDKNIDFSLFARIAPRVAGLYLLDGTALDAISAAAGDFDGPFSSLSAALDAAVSAARPGEVVLLSPGCASFGMFQNEFDRGRTFRDLVRAL